MGYVVAYVCQRIFSFFKCSENAFPLSGGYYFQNVHVPLFLYKCVIEILTDIFWCCGHIFYSTALISMSICKFAIKQPLQHSYLEALAKMAFTIFTHDKCVCTHCNLFVLSQVTMSTIFFACGQGHL